MLGTILILDGISTNRIMLKVQLSASYYHVVQADRITDLPSLLRRCRPDLILTAMRLPDGNAMDVGRIIGQPDLTPRIPIIAIAAENDKESRIAALASGIEDVINQPISDRLLQARIRSLMRARLSEEDPYLSAVATREFGFSEPVASFGRKARVTVISNDSRTALRWQMALKSEGRHHFTVHPSNDIQALLADPVADAFVIEVSNAPHLNGLQMISDLRARASTHHAAMIAVVDPANMERAVEALDRGAHDVMQNGFDPAELMLRLDKQLQRKARFDQLRASVRSGLRDAVLDPMTGLYNRRYALPYLSRTLREAVRDGTQFALLLADLDHFKRINDEFGHLAGDAVLVETADRLHGLMRPIDMLARVGGEEFMIVMPCIDSASATEVAGRLCREINARPFAIKDHHEPVPLTISIGAMVGLPGDILPSDIEGSAKSLIEEADRALYQAKNGGRNQVMLSPEQAA
ncbi:diguanylate cyclase domain-containing protein [Heliomarina baculiformis]|uniref:diguanylate cyclase domain-containing protein n=1 Tax=Heliomarina baculiformis TaxID=2872036 RepID=UPI003080863C